MADRLGTVKNAKGTDRVSFRTLALNCLLYLNDVVATEDDAVAWLRERIEDERGRFRIWASNLGALHNENSAKSLEFRLRNSERMHQSVTDGLKRLEDLTYRIYRIVSGILPNRIAKFPAGDDERLDTIDYDGERPTSEVDELCLGINSAISHLFSLSMLIRRQRPKGRFPNPENFVSQEHSADITHVRDKFPKLGHSAWLMQRLGNAITMRREALRYRQSHREELAVQSKPDGISEHLSEVVAATTFVESTNDQDEPKTEVQNYRDRESFFTSATSFISNYSNPGDIGPRIPDLSDMILDGVSLQYGESFECPYCRTIQNVPNRMEWKRHVYSDLQPYVCTFEHCLSQPFESRHGWFQHEIDNHRRQWLCNFCSGSATALLSKVDMENHLRESHVNSVTAAQLTWLLEACDRPSLQSGTLCCLFCDQWDPKIESGRVTTQFGRHVARHLQAIALASMPLEIDGLQIRSHDSENEDDSDTASEANEGTFEDIGEPLNTNSAANPTLSTRYPFRAKALYSYKGDPKDPTELSFSKGEILHLVTWNRLGWLEASKENGEEGIAPNNYLSLIENEIDELSGKSSSRGSRESLERYPYRARAVYSYEADPAVSDEMSFRVNEILEISHIQDNWWRARRENGEEGIVPSNYLILL